MIPKITTGGKSFKGAFMYYMHDKKADTRERVAWTQTENMLTEDPDKAWRVMAYTAMEQVRLKEAAGQSRAGRKLEKPVFAYSLAWHPEQEPDKEHMLDTARQSLRMMGLDEHETLIVAHQDEPQKHVHVIVNRVHPITGRAGDVRNSKRKFSDFAREYETQHGKIYCMQREQNHEKREQGKQTRYHDPVITQAWASSDNGKSFAAALKKEGYTLARGRKRLVVVDPHGKAHNPVRHLEGVKAGDFNTRMNDLDQGRLPDADHVPKLSDDLKLISDFNKQTQGNDSLTSEFNKKAQTVDQSTLQKTGKQGESSGGKEHKQPDENETVRKQFEEQAALRLNAQQDRHLEEDGKLHDKYHSRLTSAKDRLSRHYQFRQKKEHIKDLIEKTRSPSWWRRVIGAAQRDKQELKQSVQTYKNAYQRFTEKIGGIKSERKQAIKDLRDHHETERSELRDYIDLQRRTGEYGHTKELQRSKEQVRQFQKEQQNTQNQGRGMSM